MNMFKPTAAKTPNKYIALLDEPRKSQIQALHTLIRKTVPQLQPFIIAGMIGYGKMHYKSASGREGDWALIGLASQKQYISLYICAVKDGRYVADYCRKQLPKANIGKSCVRFRKIEDVDLEVIKKMMKEAARLGKIAFSI